MRFRGQILCTLVAATYVFAWPFSLHFWWPVPETRIEVKIIALGDKLSNIRAINWDYQTIGDLLWERFNQKDKENICWYYRSVAEATRELSEFPAWKEFNDLIKRAFD